MANKKLKNIFISHCNCHEFVYTKIEEFLRALKLNPLVVEKEPNKSNSLGKKVERIMNKCGIGIIVGTPDDLITKGNQSIFQPRGSILEEKAKAEIFYKENVIYLKEKNAEYPTISKEKAYYSFEIIGNDKVLLNEVFIGILKELRAFGIKIGE